MRRASAGPSRWCALGFLGLLLLATVAAAAVPPHLDEMPTVDRVLAIQGRDRLDAAARQAVILQQLIYMVATLSEGRQARDQLTADERRLVQTYAGAIAQVEDRVLATFEAEGSHRQQAEEAWAARRAEYAGNEAFRHAVLERFFSPEWQASYRAAAERDGRELTTASAPRSFVLGVARSVLLPVAVLGAGAFGLFFVVRLLIRRRQSRAARETAPLVDILEATATQALRDLRRATAVPAGKRSRR